MSDFAVAGGDGVPAGGPLDARSGGGAGGSGAAGTARPGSAGGRPRLSEREQSVLRAYASGLTLDAAARKVGIRPSTAKTYLERVKAKYRQAGRPAYTKLELAQRVNEDCLFG
jgi:two-component system, NarL family, nitrate/nitrite response regulator NarL